MLPVVTIFQVGGEEVLRRPAAAIEPAAIVARSTQRLIDDMRKTMRSADGIGLAGPQVGQSLQVAVIHRDAHKTLKKDLVMINPVIRLTSPEQIDFEEGCLSIPGVYGQVQRPARVEMEATDATGKRYTLAAEGLLARVIQHEVDHLQGKLFIDRTDRITRGRDLLS